MTQAMTETQTQTAGADQVGMLREFRDQVKDLMAIVRSAEKDLFHAEQLVKDRKSKLKAAQQDLAAYINDDRLPLLDSANNQEDDRK